MKITPVLLVVLLLTLFATSLVQAQTTEKITLYADRAGTDCSISDTREGTLFVYMFHVGTTGTRNGCEFRAPKPECWTGATWVGDNFQPSFLYIGTSQGGDLSVAYAACLPLPVYIGKMIFEVTGAAQACCPYPVLSSVWHPSVLTVDCQIPPPQEIPILGGSAVINEDPSCPCEPPLAVESTTWGRVKSLYN
jgi:hypothetical protein